MALNKEQRDALTAAATRKGVDPAALLAEAESLQAGAPSSPGGKAAPGAEKPNLYMYLLPFVTVNEVRTIWLELDAVTGGDQYAGEWAAEQAAASGAPEAQDTTE